jgi:hypothetical protein
MVRSPSLMFSKMSGGLCNPWWQRGCTALNHDGKYGFPHIHRVLNLSEGTERHAEKTAFELIGLT